jgi:hypothetical protein
MPLRFLCTEVAHAAPQRAVMARLHPIFVKITRTIPQSFRGFYADEKSFRGRRF